MNKVYLQFPFAFWEKRARGQPSDEEAAAEQRKHHQHITERHAKFKQEREEYLYWVERSTVPGTEFNYWDPCFRSPFKAPQSWDRWQSVGAEGAYQFILNEAYVGVKQPILV